MAKSRDRQGKDDRKKPQLSIKEKRKKRHDKKDNDR